jgi:hypothetical protein
MVDTLPQTTSDFAQMWRDSLEYRELITQIDTYNQQYPVGDKKSLTAMRKTLNGADQKG